jgi:hypothetical protein
MLITIVSRIVHAGTAQDIHHALQGEDLQTQYDALKMASEKLSQEVELHIQSKEHHLAIWQLSKLAVVDDHILIVERKLNGVTSLPVAGGVE